MLSQLTVKAQSPIVSSQTKGLQVLQNEQNFGFGLNKIPFLFKYSHPFHPCSSCNYVGGKSWEFCAVYLLTNRR